VPVPQTLFAGLLGIVALAGLVAVVRSWGGSASNRGHATGWLIVAVAAAIQVANLLLGYSWWISALTTAGLFVGLWMGLPRPRNLS
jgi:hypothetical protein